MANGEGLRGWLMLAAGEDRQHAGNSGYEDLPSERYSWDSTVPNHGRVGVGDLIAIWDRHTLLGASVIDRIVEGSGSKDVFRCPACGRSKIKTRSTRRPLYRCHECSAEFDVPLSRQIDVDTYRSEHGAAWVDLEGRVDGPTLRGICQRPKSQLSMRPLDTERFLALLEDVDEARALIVSERAAQLRGGHRTRTVRARIGQPAFRTELIRRFGPVCAFSGAAPLDALEAAHLYRFADSGEHDAEGGLLVRRDLHRLFDLGHLTVDTDDRIHLSAMLRESPQYVWLDGRPLQVPTTARHRDWLKRHRANHRHLEGSQPSVR